MKAVLALILTLQTPASVWAATYVYVSVSGERRIAVYEMTPVTGKLTPRGDAATDGQPGVLCANPDRTILYAAILVPGSIAGYRIDPDTGRLRKIGTGSTERRRPSFITADRTGRFLLTSYYRDGKVAVHGVTPGGAPSAQALQWATTTEKAHCIRIDKRNRFAFVPHTRPNRIYQFRFDAKTGRLTPNDPRFVQRPQNTGPRHYIHHPRLNMVYATDEQGNSLSAYRFAPARGTLEHMQTLSTLPKDFAQRNSTSHVEIHPSGRFVYVGNRGHNSIASFATDPNTGRLTVIGRVPTEAVPRGFAVAPGGRFFYSAGQQTGKLAAYRLDTDTGRLTRIGEYDVGKRPGWVFCVTTTARGNAEAPIPNPVLANPVYDDRLPRPEIVQPRLVSELAAASQPPADAIVLFDGTDMPEWSGFPHGKTYQYGVEPAWFEGKWLARIGRPPAWKVADGAMEVTDTSSIATKRSFGSCRLHIEWRSFGKDRGNSGIYFQGRYELAILDSHNNRVPISPDRQCGAIFGQYPPRVNACRPPGQWQSYDVIFTAPRFDADGGLTRAASMVVHHNGMRIHDGEPLTGPTKWRKKVNGQWPPRMKYRPHGRQPLLLQAHGDRVQLRNIWLQELND